MSTTLRCHLLIGPPASGKTTIANLLAAELQAEVLSTDLIREELYGDPLIQGHWPDIAEALHVRLKAKVAEGLPVIVDATHARRPWRLAMIQALELPQPVEWIGWWLTTPIENCLAWNRSRQRMVPEPVIHQFAAALADPVFAPDRAEGLTALVDFDPSVHSDLTASLRACVKGLEKRIAAARNREKSKDLHGYSRLLDLERLLFLIQLLSRYPGLSAKDPATREELETICNPLPEGDLAQRAGVYLSRLRGECYGDSEALVQDLKWLKSQGFFQVAPVTAAIVPPPAGTGLESNLGGWPALADTTVFLRVMTLLRHLLQSPFDQQKGTPLPSHLIDQLQGIPGGYVAGESATLRKDIERVLTPYGFRSRNDNVCHGYALGAAVLSAPRLREIHNVVAQSAKRLGDPTAQDLLAELDERLRWGGVLADDDIPVRVFANRSIVHPDLVRADSLANPLQAEKLEDAIAANQRVVLERFSQAAQFDDSATGELRVWPLQLVFHNIGWYLAYEEDAVGRECGLIRTERLDRLALRQVDAGFVRPAEARRQGVERLSRLMEMSGGIYFGDEIKAQLELCQDDRELARAQLVTVRFSCKPWVYLFLREGLQRYPLAQMRLSRPLPGDKWRQQAAAPFVLAPIKGAEHPYPVEIDLPRWTVDRDVDFRRWLFGYGEGIKLESPVALAEEHGNKAKAVAALYPLQEATGS